MDADFNINDLPEEVIETLFRYLKHDDLSRVGRVCKKWYAMSRDPILWKAVHVQASIVKYSSFPRQISESIKKFLLILPPCVIQLKIGFDLHAKINSDILIELSKISNLEVLIFYKIDFTFNRNIFKLLPVDIRVLAVQNSCVHVNCYDKYPLQKTADSSISKIEVLDISYSDLEATDSDIQCLFLKMPLLRNLRLAGCSINIHFFSNLSGVMSQLEVLDLEDTKMCAVPFQIVCNYGFNLTELYICRTLLLDKDFRTMFNANATKTNFPRLKIICFRSCNVTYNTINALIKSCPSLQHVYVGDVRKNSMYDYTKCNSKKVHINDTNMPCYHFQKANYMRK